MNDDRVSDKMVEVTPNPILQGSLNMTLLIGALALSLMNLSLQKSNRETQQLLQMRKATMAPPVRFRYDGVVRSAPPSSQRPDLRRFDSTAAVPYKTIIGQTRESEATEPARTSIKK